MRSDFQSNMDAYCAFFVSFLTAMVFKGKKIMSSLWEENTEKAVQEGRTLKINQNVHEAS